MQVIDASVLFDLGPPAFRTTFSSFIAGLLGLAASQISVEDAVVVPGAAISLDNAKNIPMRIQFQALPLPNPTVQVRALKQLMGLSPHQHSFHAFVVLQGRAPKGALFQRRL